MAAIYNFPDIKQTNTFKERTITVIVDGSPLDLTGATVCMQVRERSTTQVVFEFPITITDAPNGVLTIAPFNVVMHPKTYEYDLRITLSDGTILTYIQGNFPVLTVISRC